jgi:ribonuclease-3
MRRDLKDLQKKMGYRFRSPVLLEQALLHTSYVNESGLEKSDSNQRLEFLGDAVVELTVTQALFDLLPDADEGTLSSLRAKLVCTASLSGVARGLNVGEYIVLGKGAEKGHERENPTVLEDAFEAIVGAVYLDSGWKKASSFVYKCLEVSILNVVESSGRVVNAWDKKTALQIELQKNGSVRIEYVVCGEQGPNHEKVFEVEVYADGRRLGAGFGYSKKEAEQDAAGHALKILNVS